MDGCLIPAEAAIHSNRLRQFIGAALEPLAGLDSHCSVPKVLPLAEVVVCLYTASLVRNA